MVYQILNLKTVVERRTKLLKDSGIKFVQNFEVGKIRHCMNLKRNMMQS